MPRQLAAFGAAVALLDGLAVLTFSALLVPAESRAVLLLGGLAVMAVGAALAATLASGAQRLWLAPLRQLATSLDQNTLAVYAGAGMPEVTILDNAVRRFQQRMLTRLDQSQREHAELVAIFNQMADGVLVLGSDERVVLSNPASARLLGRQVLLDRPLPEVARDPDLIQIARAASAGPVVQLVIAPEPSRAYNATKSPTSPPRAETPSATPTAGLFIRSTTVPAWALSVSRVAPRPDLVNTARSGVATAVA